MAPRQGHIFKPIDQRLSEKSIPEPNSGCLIWLGATNGQGYGTMTMGHGTRAYAHRVSYESERGLIPEGLSLDHLCRNSLCINPDHLEPVTNRENTLRGKVSALRPDPTHCVHGHDYSTSGYVNQQGKQQCRICQKVRNERYKRSRTNV